MLVLIPIKDYSNTKTRLKSELPSEQKQIIENIVEATFLQTLHLLNKTSLSFGVVSPSKRIIHVSKQMGAEFTYLDKGTDLNEALSQATEKLPLNKAILIVMPDLPFLSFEFLVMLKEKIENNDLIIVPSISGELGNIGTAMLYMRQPNLVSFSFGKNSSDQHQKEAQELNLQYKILEFDPYARDLDTLPDLQYLQDHLKMVDEPIRFESLLKNLF